MPRYDVSLTVSYTVDTILQVEADSEPSADREACARVWRTMVVHDPDGNQVTPDGVTVDWISLADQQENE